MQETGFLFLVQANGGPINAQAKAVVNAHTARQSHRKRRSRQQQETRSFVSSGPRRVSDRPQCGLHRSTFMRQCPWCQQAASAWTSVLLHCGNSDPFDSLPVPIDVKANRYFSFGRVFVGPLVRGIGPPDLVMSPGQAQLKVVADSVDHLCKDLPLHTPHQELYMSHQDTMGSHIASQYTLALSSIAEVASCPCLRFLY